MDDELRLCEAYQRKFSSAGLHVDFATDGSAALQLLEKGGYDAILSDVKMEGMGGIEFLRALRARNFDIPVVLMTGEPSVQSAAEAIGLGALQFFVKPVEFAELEPAVMRAVRLHRLTIAKLQTASLTESDSLRVTGPVGLEGLFESVLNSLWLAFQPVIRASDNSVFGHEALLRSAEPVLSTPMAVIEAAQRLDRMTDVGRAVRARAAEAVTKVAGAVFVNLHPRDLFDPDLADEAAPLTALSSRVVLELNERAALGSPSDVKPRVARLKSLGFRIALDDLGAGYASMSSLALLEPDFVKLDSSLVRDVHRSRTKQRLIRSIAGLARDLGILTVAEGVEQVEERDQLVELKCDMLQGFFFGRPDRGFAATTG